MFKIEDYNIYHTRGDTGGFSITFTLNGETPDYEAVFTVKKSLADKKHILQKPVVSGHVDLLHEDTQNIPYGNYYYDIQIHVLDGTDRYFTAGPHRYYLKPDVTTEVSDG